MNDILVDEEYGFRPNVSTAIASYKLINEILVAKNNKMSVVGNILSPGEDKFDLTFVDKIISHREISKRT